MLAGTIALVISACLEKVLEKLSTAQADHLQVRSSQRFQPSHIF